MRDEVYVFNQTSRERKSAGTGAFHKKGGSKSKRCTLPSDHLTPSQLKKRSSAVMTYNISKPMSYAGFKKLDDNAKRFYLEAIIQKYKPRAKDLAEMFGCSHGTLTTILKKYPSAKAMLNKDRINNGMSKEWAYFIDPVTHDSAPDLIPAIASVADTTGEQVTATVTKEITTPIEEVTTPSPISISGSITLDATPMQLVSILRNIFGDTVHHFSISFE